MKKSQLRKIIRESIRGLMNEQSTPTGKPIASKSCGDPGTMAFGSSRRVLVNDNGTLRDPLVGDTFCVGGSPNSYYTQHGCNSEIIQVGSGCDGCPPPIGTGTGNCGVQCWKTPRTITTLTNGCSDPSCVCPGSCDTSTSSPCATQWFGNTAGNFTAWMASKDCSNYQSVVNQQEPQATTIMAGSQSPQTGPYNNWNDIKNAANASGLTGTLKGQFKRKMAKAMYAQCQIAACSC